MNKPKFFKSGKGEDNKHAYHTPLEKKVNELLTPFQEYINSQVTASIFLFCCTLAALLWASVPAISSWYNTFVNIPLGIYIANNVYQMPLQFWVNDVLLTLFFFFVGLEIKREFLVGELTNHKRAIFVLFAAIGGMVVPASIYLAFNAYTPTQIGWGIPMATDTAFALGILSCFKNKIPKGIFTFLAALAIIDDIGAIIVIAVFYTVHLSIFMLFISLLLLGVLILMNYAGFRKPFQYLIIGLMVWAAIEAAGIHGTIAGILVAFVIPARPRKGPRQFIKKTRDLLSRFEEKKEKTPLILKDQQQHAVLEEVQEVAQQATTPLQRWESKLELPIALLILPLFALTNAGIPLNLHLIDNVFTHRVSLGILLGLVLGKPIGVLLFSGAAKWLRLGILPENTTFFQVASVAMLTGVGFTMSLFIANLSFNDENNLLMAKAAILLGSLIAATVCMIMLWNTGQAKSQD